jgi:hypothetical protein
VIYSAADIILEIFMTKKAKFYFITAIILFVSGIAIGLFLWTGSVWADLEGYMFQPATHADRSEFNLLCPHLITTNDFGVISIGIENNFDKDVKKVVRGYKSLGYVIYVASDETSLELTPGESEVMHWYIYPEDAAWNRFVLFRVNIISSRGTGLTTASCGVMVVNVPFLKSNQFFLLALLSGTLLIAAGIYLMYRSSLLQGKNNFYYERLMLSITGVMIIGLLLAFFGQWLVGGLLLVAMYLFLMVTITHYVQKWMDKPPAPEI